MTFAQANTDYVQGVVMAGGMPLLLAPVESMDIAPLAARLDGLLLTGGGDVDPAFYGEENRCGLVPDRVRDRFELELCRAFAGLGKPILAICRGIQVLNIALGGGICQDILADTGLEHSSEWTARHSIAVEPGSFLAPFLSTGAVVNSTHHQAVSTLAPGFRTAAWCGGLVEAVESTEGLPFWGVQWHPERLLLEVPAMAGIFDLFVKRC